MLAARGGSAHLNLVVPLNVGPCEVRGVGRNKAAPRVPPTKQTDHLSFNLHTLADYSYKVLSTWLPREVSTRPGLIAICIGQIAHIDDRAGVAGCQVVKRLRRIVSLAQIPNQAQPASATDRFDTSQSQAFV